MPHDAGGDWREPVGKPVRSVLLPPRACGGTRCEVLLAVEKRARPDRRYEEAEDRMQFSRSRKQQTQVHTSVLLNFCACGQKPPSVTEEKV